MLQAGAEVAADTAVRVVAPVAVVVEAVAVTEAEMDPVVSVSYTHLTLPTILLV